MAHFNGSVHGIANVRAPVNALLGVFLGPDQPDATPAPAGLNFATLGLDFTSLAPALKQPFFIGDGATPSDVVQHFVVPAGATRLYLGILDGFGWHDNTGAIAITVTAVPEPQRVLLWLAGLALLAGAARGPRR